MQFVVAIFCIYAEENIKMKQYIQKYNAVKPLGIVILNFSDLAFALV